MRAGGRRWWERLARRGDFRPDGVIGLLVVWAVGLLGGNNAVAATRVSALTVQVPPSASGAGRDASSAGFTRLASEQTGIWFTNRLSDDCSITNTIVNNGSGVACGDVDGDGLPDVYFCSLEGSNALYRNLGGWRFENITVAAGVGMTNALATGAVLVDVDGDRDLDLLVSGIGWGVRLFLNDGHGRFTERPDAGLVGRYGATSMALADADGDGDLDLYVANYRTSTIMDQPGVRFTVSKVQGRPVVTRVDGVPADSAQWEGRFTVGPNGALREAGEPDVFYLNDGRGRFTPVSWTGGTFLDEQGQPLRDPPRDWGLSVMFRDLNGDGAPDLYVCNDADSPDRLWFNDGVGHFRAAPALALRHTSLSSMGVDAADLNRDGRDDLFVLDMLARRHEKRQTQLEKSRPSSLESGDVESRPQYSRNTLQVRREDGTYAEVAYAAGLPAADWAWCPIFLDVDLDGFEDLLIANGFHREVEDMDVAERLRAAKAGGRVSPREELRMRAMFPRWETPNLAFRNRGDLTFEEVGQRWGFDTVGISQGMALADFDGDGDLDVVMNNLNAGAGLYRNDGTGMRVAVRLAGLGANSQGIGARLRFSGGPVPVQTQEIQAGGRYLSGDEATRVFAAGRGSHTLEVRWRSGRFSVVSNLVGNSGCVIDERDAVATGVEKPVETPRVWFEEVSGLLNHRHVEAGFDDSLRQPLLSRRLGQMGPGLAWCDLDGDGRDDLVVGGARGGGLGVRLNRGTNGFQAVELPGLGALVADTAGVLGWSLEPGHATLLVAQDAYTTAGVESSGVIQHDLFFGNLESRPVLTGVTNGLGPLALADMDGDGALDLFVGSRVDIGRYPAPASSRVLRRVGRQWEADGELDALLRDVGLVRGAAWLDLEGDGFPELVLACEWGSIRVFRNQKGRLTAWDPEVKWEGRPEVRHASDLTGWWTGITGGDFDGDGRLDLVVGNWGRNSRYGLQVEAGLGVYHGDLDDNGTWDVIETYRDPFLEKEVPWVDWKALQTAVPGLAGRFPNYAAYARASVQEILGTALAKLSRREARTLDSVVMLNRGAGFEIRSLPAEAQWSPVFGLVVGDADGDGREDVFLAQNFFGMDPESGRSDAGRGLWLKGDGKGGFAAVDGARSGVRIYGEQRGAALADYDQDGRVDLVVAQNGGETKLYRNREARPGLRVRLSGPEGNPRGFGAVIRVGKDGAWGPARAVQAGSGWWSQDSPVQVMAGAKPGAKIEVRWPGGQVSTAEIPAGSAEVEVPSPGTGQRARR